MRRTGEAFTKDAIHQRLFLKVVSLFLLFFFPSLFLSFFLCFFYKFPSSFLFLLLLFHLLFLLNFVFFFLSLLLLLSSYFFIYFFLLLPSFYYHFILILRQSSRTEENAQVIPKPKVMNIFLLIIQNVTKDLFARSLQRVCWTLQRYVMRYDNELYE